MSEQISTIKHITVECERCDGLGLMDVPVSRTRARTLNLPDLEGQTIQKRCTKCNGSGRVQS